MEKMPVHAIIRKRAPFQWRAFLKIRLLLSSY
jgi:hypothetical protein